MLQKIFFVASFVFVLSCSSILVRQNTGRDASVPLGQLPDLVVPQHYEIELAIDPHLDRFTGSIRVSAEVKTALSTFWIHGRNLSVTESYMILENGDKINVRYEQVSPQGVAQITLPHAIEAQQVFLFLKYNAPLQHGLDGLYKVADGGQPYVFTQFEPIAARQCFPGFDEPRFKTPFLIKLIIPKALTAISNTSVLRETFSDGGQKYVEFKETLALPTYLVAIAVGDFDVIEAPPIAKNTLRGPIPLRGIATKGKGTKLQYALSKTPALINTLEQYFAVAYPFDKLDLIAVPDFVAGAMENAGAITFREWLLLMDETSAPVSQKRAFAETAAHELAHMWFGDLVTMRWWNDLWLNEAFATWMGHHVVQEWEPSYRSTLELLEEAQFAMQEDSLLSARRITQPIDTYHDIFRAFDAITYSKGGAIIRMFEHKLGSEIFRDGVRYHLKRFRFGNASTEDFLDSLSYSAQEDVREAFQTFLTQPGVPNIKVKPQCSRGAYSMTLEQSRYLPIGSPVQPAQTWAVPFCFKYGTAHSANEKCILLSSALQQVHLDTCPTWMLLNAEGAGYYRADAPLFSKSSTLHMNEFEKLEFLDNQFARMRGGTASAKQVFSNIEALSPNASRDIASQSFHFLSFLDAHLISDDLKPKYRTYLNHIFKPVYQRLRNAHQGEEAHLYYAEISHFLAQIADNKKIGRDLETIGQDYFHAITLPGPTEPKIDLNLAQFGLAALLRSNAQRYVPAIIEALKSESSSSTRRNLIFALGQVEGEQMGNAIRDLLLQPYLRRNEILELLRSHLSMSKNRQQGWLWLKANFSKLTQVLPEESAGRLPLATRSFCTGDLARDVKEFFHDSIAKYPGGPGNLKETTEAITQCADFVSHYKNEVAHTVKAKSWL